MAEGDAVFGAVKETTVFLAHFDDLPDYWQKGRSPIRLTRCCW